MLGPNTIKWMREGNCVCTNTLVQAQKMVWKGTHTHTLSAVGAPSLGSSNDHCFSLAPPASHCIWNISECQCMFFSTPSALTPLALSCTPFSTNATHLPTPTCASRWFWGCCLITNAHSPSICVPRCQVSRNRGRDANPWSSLSPRNFRV